MSVRTNDKAGAPIDEMCHCLFFRRCFGVHINQDRVGSGFQRAGGQLLFHRLKRAIHFIHVNPAHRIDHQHLGAIGGLKQPGPSTRCSGRVVDRTQ